MNTRDPDEIQKVLSGYPNLQTASRDRCYSYKAVSKECTHIADRFHLIMILSEAISKEIKGKIPMYINITNIRSEEISIDYKDVKMEYTDKQKEKQKIILEIKKESAKGKSDRSIAREYLINLNTLCFVNLINSKYEDSCINKFIASLKTDWEAVINAASYGISNGITEGSINKIKQIKRDMYGRASYELLRKKVIYQSLFS